ncbi:MAG: fumarylacetoacetate hydrolase family protein [Proteobacteria bacterium]|nr:fumarylacetoacetate hydrolase family protein [Pseudomonadota bacterium]
MKFASLKNKTRDGELCLVSKDLQCAVKVTEIVPTLQQLLDNWNVYEKPLQTIYTKLNAKTADNIFSFDPEQVMAPLPRAYQWADGSAYVNHVELVRKARGAEMPQNFWTDPLMYQGGSDKLLGPYEDIEVISEEFGIDFEGEVAVITDDAPMGVKAEVASQHIKLLMLVNDVSLRNLIPEELNKGFGFFQSKPATAFSPVAVTPDELGSAWDGKKVNLPLHVYYNNELFGHPNAGIDMTFDFPRLISHAAKTRYLSSGSIIGSGTVSNTDRTQGAACIMERRMLEIIKEGKASTPFMHFGDSVRIEMFDAQGQSIFGAINQKVVCYKE